MSTALQAEIENLTREILKVVLPNPDAGTDYENEHGDRLYADAMIYAVTALLDALHVGPVLSANDETKSQRIVAHADLVYAAAARYKAAVLLAAASDVLIGDVTIPEVAHRHFQTAKKLLGKD